MSSLIDCVFLLLIFFMLSSTFLAPKIRLDLPRAAMQPNSSQNDPIIVSIDVQGDLYLNNEQVAWEQLENRLRASLVQADQKVVTIRCDETAEHRHFVRVLDAAKSCGAKRGIFSNAKADEAIGSEADGFD